MQEFMQFFNSKTKDYPMYLEIYYSKVMDWCIHVYKKGCGDNESDLEILSIQESDMELCFAKAQVELKEWLLEHEGGY